MKNTIKVELKEYILEGIKDLNLDNLTSKPGRLDANELHQSLFNEDYYIIGYFNAQQWLDKHFIDTFEALEDIKEYEEFNFGQAKHYTDVSIYLWRGINPGMLPGTRTIIILTHKPVKRALFI